MRRFSLFEQKELRQLKEQILGDEPLKARRQFKRRMLLVLLNFLQENNDLTARRHVYRGLLAALDREEILSKSRRDTRQDARWQSRGEF
jgi:hypothetical protein